MPKLIGTALAAALLLFSVSRPGPVLAHAEYDKSEPPADGVVKTAPALVKVWFTEGVKKDGTSLAVTDSQGKTVDRGDSTLVSSDPDHKTITISLQPNLPAGTYTVNWKTVADDDGDEDEGDFSFKIDPTAAAAPSTAAVAAPAAVVAAPVAQPAVTPVAGPVQAPRALPQTGESWPVLPLTLLALAGVLLLAGLVVRWSPRLR